MENKKEGRRSTSPHRAHHTAGTRPTLVGQPGQMQGSLNILSTILRSPHPSLHTGHQRTLPESIPTAPGRGQSPIRVITTLAASGNSSVSPRAGLSPSRTPTTLPPKKSLSPSRPVYAGSRSPSPKPLKSADHGQGQSQGRQGQGQLLSHLPYLAQTLQGSRAPEDLFQQYKVQQIPGAQLPLGIPPGSLLKEAGQTVVAVGRRSPGRQAQPMPQPAHQRIPTPPAVRRTPSPAHMPVGADPTAKVIVAHTGAARPQAVNLVKTSAHQPATEARIVDTDFKYGDLLQSINRSHESIQSHFLQGGLSPITPSDPVSTRPWSSQPPPQLVPVPSVALSLGHALSSGTFSHTHGIQPPIRSSGAAVVAHTSVSPAVGFTPVVLPSHSYQSKNSERLYSVPVPASSAVSSISTSSHPPAVSFIHSLGTPAQSVSMTEPGPPNITISSCGTIPSQDRPLQKLPRNPFTFPATPPVSLANERPATIGLGSPIIQSKVKQEAKLTANEKQRHGSDEMPQLSPVKKVEVKKEDEEDLVSIPNAYNMRLQTLANIPNNPTYRPTYRATSVAIHKAKVACITNSAKSLDLLRQNLQKSINKEISAIIQSYMDKYFKLGIENIRLNNGETAVTDDHVQAVCRQILEEAKKMYITETERQSVSPARELSDNVSETGSSGRRSALGRRRHPSDTDSEASLRPAGNTNKKKKGRYIVNLTGRSTPSKLAMQQSKREGPKFEPERLTEETLFVMGSKANKAMGFGATRGRLYMKHPELFKYSGDQDDKTWLYEHQHMPATGGKSYLIVLDDVRELALNDEYRDAPGITVESLSGFTVPMWMIEKMRIQMVAMRTDLPKQAKYRSRSTTPNEGNLVPEEINDEESPPKEMKDLPFSSFSSPKQNSNLEVMEASATDEDLEFLSNTGNSNTPSQMSPFNMTGGFDDTASQSDLDTLDDDTGFSLVK